jgi:hypothetical protein
MSVARVTELSAVSEKGFEDASNIVGYKANVAITFVLEDES